VEFSFFPPNHSVARAEYKYPCIPYELVTHNQGFFSGFFPLDTILNNPPSYSIRVNDTEPIFYYCTAPGSCIGYGMVGVINPVTNLHLSMGGINLPQNATTPLQTQIDLAKNSTYMLQPGDRFPSEGSQSSEVYSSTSPTATSTTSSSTASSTATSSSNGGGSSFPKGAIAGISVGVVAIIGLAAALCFFVGRARTLKETVNRQSIVPSMVSFGAAAGAAPGHLSPAGPPPAPPSVPSLDPYGGGAYGAAGYAPGGNGTVFVPVKAAELHRFSLTTTGAYAQPAAGGGGPPQLSPLATSPEAMAAAAGAVRPPAGGSPEGQFVHVSHYDVGVQQHQQQAQQQHHSPPAGR
jgi:hypothetical protein